MNTQTNIEIPEVFSSFQIAGDCISCTEITTGHIHRTFLGSWSNGKRYIHQLFNDHVFTDIIGVSKNIETVLKHLHLKGETVLVPIPTDTGAFIVKDDSDFWWRTFAYVEDTESFNACLDVQMAYDAAKTFGTFQEKLRDLPIGTLIDPIPDFMNCKKRLALLKEANLKGEVARRELVMPEIHFAVSREDSFALLSSRNAGTDHQTRPTHGDMKLNNLLFSTKTRKPVCVIDLDTCMDGSYLFDFGDMVRTACSAAKEDEVDLTRIEFREDLFEGIVSGYAEAMGSYLTGYEKNNLVAASILLTLTVGVRFLTDYLSGDVYFRTEYPEHNLVRSRAQFALVKKIEEKRSKLSEIVAKHMKIL